MFHTVRVKRIIFLWIRLSRTVTYHNTNSIPMSEMGSSTSHSDVTSIVQRPNGLDENAASNYREKWRQQLLHRLSMSPYNQNPQSRQRNYERNKSFVIESVQRHVTSDSQSVASRRQEEKKKSFFRNLFVKSKREIW